MTDGFPFGDASGRTTNTVSAEEQRHSAVDRVNGSSFSARRRKLPWSDIATALSPGPTESFFEERSGAGKTNLYRLIPKKSAADVARAGYEGMKRGSAAVIPGAISKVLVFAGELPPRSIAAAVSRLLLQDATR